MYKNIDLNDNTSFVFNGQGYPPNVLMSTTFSETNGLFQVMLCFWIKLYLLTTLKMRDKETGISLSSTTVGLHETLQRVLCNISS